MPYAVENIQTGERVKHFRQMPKSLEIEINGKTRRIVSPVKVGDEGLGYRFIEIVEVGFEQPGQFFRVTEDVETREGNVVTITRHWEAWPQEEIDAYENARLDDIASQIMAVDAPVRAALLVVLDEFNRHSVMLRAIQQAGANATSLANFRSAMAAINSIPVRQPSDLLNAVRAKLGQTV